MICPKCHKHLAVDTSALSASGSRFKCPNCGAQLVSNQPSAAVKKQDVILQISKGGKVVECREPMDSELFMTTDTVIGMHVLDVMFPDIAQPVIHFTAKTLQTRELQSFEYQHPSSKQHYEIKCIFVQHDRTLVIISNISAYKQAAEQVKHLAYHDSLTNLPNRYLFNDRLQQAIAHADREKKLLAILFLDLDNFKHINDTLGHRTGDELLKSVATRLKKDVRVTDSVAHLSEEYTEVLMARVGGDEFLLLLDTIINIRDPAMVAGRILSMLSELFTLGGNEVFVTASMGIAVYPFDGNNIDTLLINADVAYVPGQKSGKKQLSVLFRAHE